MCYSVFSLLSQTNQIPTVDADRQNYGDSTVIPSSQDPLPDSSYPADSVASTPTSGYGSYSNNSSPGAGSPDAVPIELLENGIFDADSSCFSPPGSATHSLHSPSHGYSDSYSPQQQQRFCSQQQFYPINEESHYSMCRPYNSYCNSMLGYNYPLASEGGILVSKVHNLKLQQVACRVCGDIASGNHFGVQSCEACKSFYRRSIRSNTRYACRGNRSCTIEKHTRNRCQYCRLRKCAAMGMRKEAVQDERTPQGVNTKFHRAGTPTTLGFNFNLPNVPYFTQNSDSPTSPLPKILSQAANRMYGSLPNLKVEVECSPSPPPDMVISPEAKSFPLPQFDASSAVSMLVNADMQSESKPEATKQKAIDIKLEDLFEGMKASLFRMIEWSKRIPTFSSLSLDDQMKLLKSSWCEYCTLKLAAQNGVKSDAVLLANGLTCSKSDIEDPEVKRILIEIFSGLAYWLDFLNVDHVELACLKGILLFNPDAKGLSPVSKKKVEIFQEQILQSLETRTKTMYPVSPQRFSKLLLRLAPLKAISLEVKQQMEVQRALGDVKIDRLFGELLDFQ